jgi:hypothetical protein
MKNGRSIFSVAGCAALVALLLAGCGLGSGATGGSMSFSFSPSARALGEGESYRVEVYYGSDLYTAKEASTDGDIVFDALPTGRATVFVAKGSGAGAGFVASRSGSFDTTIVPGDNSPASVTLSPVPFAAAGGLAGVGVSSVVTLAGEVFAATGAGTLHRTTYAAGAFSAVTDGPTVPAGMSSLSLDVAPYFAEAGFESQVWVNGTWTPGTPATGGILPWVGDALDADFASGLMTAPWVGGVPSAFTVLRSGSYSVSDNGLAIFYQRNGGLGGVYVTRAEAGDRSGWHWITNQIDLTAALGELGAGQEAILDFTASRDAAYLVTAITTLRVSAGLLSLSGLDVQTVLGSEYVAFATGIESPIIAVAVSPGDPDTVYLGTDNGLWMGPAGSSSFFFAEGSTPEVIGETIGYRVATVSVSTGGSYVAFVSSRAGSPDTLVVMPAASPERLRAYHRLEGLPGTSLSALAWLDDGTLLVAGSGGLAALADMPD